MRPEDDRAADVARTGVPGRLRRRAASRPPSPAALRAGGGARDPRARQIRSSSPRSMGSKRRTGTARWSRCSPPASVPSMTSWWAELDRLYEVARLPRSGGPSRARRARCSRRRSRAGTTSTRRSATWTSTRRSSLFKARTGFFGCPTVRDAPERRAEPAPHSGHATRAGVKAIRAAFQGERTREPQCLRCHRCGRTIRRPQTSTRSARMRTGRGQPNCDRHCALWRGRLKEKKHSPFVDARDGERPLRGSFLDRTSIEDIHRQLKRAFSGRTWIREGQSRFVARASSCRTPVPLEADIASLRRRVAGIGTLHR